MVKNIDPKYLTISKEIIRRIETGELEAGDKVPSENELIKTYKISNTTARKSLLEVELKGWATRIKGKGTFVLNRSEDKHLTRVLGQFHIILVQLHCQKYHNQFLEYLPHKFLYPLNLSILYIE
jgi:GntR family transcriptional regulator